MNSIKTISNIDCHISFSQNVLFLVPFHLHLPLPFVCGSVDVDELFIALVSDNGVLNLFSASGQNLLLNLSSSLLPEYDPVKLAISYFPAIVGNPSSDEDQGWQ